jgi:dTDP-4-amino-4,6-dideoxy-D-glucose acyltransferase
MQEILGYYNSEELKSLGLKQCGKNVLLSKNTRLYNPEKTTIGNNVRIDDFCVITGRVDIGNFVHIAAFCLLSGKNGIKIGNFVGISGRVSLYTNNEDYVSGKGISTAAVPEKFQFTKGGTIILEDHALIGTHSVILPLAHLKKGTVIGALSLVNCICDEWTLYAGIPVKKIKKIPNEAKLELEKDIQDEEI